MAHVAAWRAHRVQRLVALLQVLLGIEEADCQTAPVVGIDQQEEAPGRLPLRPSRLGAGADLLGVLADASACPPSNLAIRAYMAFLPRVGARPPTLSEHRSALGRERSSVEPAKLEPATSCLQSRFRASRNPAYFRYDAGSRPRCCRTDQAV
jgi:hypothetical protein